MTGWLVLFCLFCFAHFTRNNATQPSLFSTYINTTNSIYFYFFYHLYQRWRLTTDWLFPVIVLSVDWQRVKLTRKEMKGVDVHTARIAWNGNETKRNFLFHFPSSSWSSVSIFIHFPLLTSTSRVRNGRRLQLRLGSPSLTFRPCDPTWEKSKR